MQMQDVRAVVSGGASGLDRRPRAWGGAADASPLDVNEQAGHAAVRALGGNAHFCSRRHLRVGGRCRGAGRERAGGLNVAVNCGRRLAWPRR